MFRRRRRKSDAEAAEETAPGSVEVGAEDDTDDDRPAEPPRPQGPWDVADAPEDPPGTQRLDLGGMRVPVAPGLELRIDMDAAQKPVAATVVSGPSAMQVNAFAAPRTEGIWAEVRAEILGSLQAGGAREVEGPFGPEVLSKVPAGPPVPGRGTPVIDARFIGVDGPRWFLRGLVSGPAATDRELAAPFEEVLRGVVVVRGGEAMAPREPLPLVLPRQVQEAAAAHAEQQSQAQQVAQAQAQQQSLGAGQAPRTDRGGEPAAAGSARPGSPQVDPREAGPDRTASRRVSAEDGQPGEEAREGSDPRTGSGAPAAPRLSMAEQLAQAARAVAARQTAGPAGAAAAAGATAAGPAPAPAAPAAAPAPAPLPPAAGHEDAAEPVGAGEAHEPVGAAEAHQRVAAGAHEPTAQPPGQQPAPEPAAPAGPASSEADLGVLDAPPSAGDGLDPAGPRP